MAITKLKDGLYEVRVTVRSKKDPDKFISRRRSGITGPKKAKQIEDELRAEVLKIADTEATQTITWDDALQQFLSDSQTRDNYSPNTVYRYEKSLSAYTVDEWKTKSLRALQTADVVNLIDRYATDYNWSAGNKQYLKKAISAVFRYGRTKGWVELNPCDQIIYKRKKPDLNIWTLSQFEEFLKYVHSKDLDWYYIFTVAGLSGCRSGELYALRWENCDFKNRLMKIVESYSTKTKQFLPTKNKLIRNVPINDDLLSILQELKIRTGGKAKDFILPHPATWTHSQQSNVLTAYAQEADLEPIRFHDLRALAACQMHLSGTSMHLIREILGWADLKVVDRYMRISGSEVMGATKNYRIKLPGGKPGKVIKIKGS